VRILLLSNLYPPYVEGGAEILAGDIASSLERLGHEVFVLTSSYGIAQPQLDGHIYRTLHLIPPAHFDRHRPLWQQVDQPLNFYRRYNYPSNSRELRRVVAEVQPDILYIWEISGIGVNSLLKALPAVHNAHNVHIPIVLHLGSYWLLYARSPETEQSRLRTRRLKQFLIGNVPALTWTSLIAVSKTVKEEYAKAGFDPSRIEVIYNGIDPRFLAPSPSLHHKPDIARDTIQLLFVGRIRVEKGILTILKALDLLAHEQNQADTNLPPLHLNLFGNGDDTYLNELQAFLSEKRLTQMVTFHGRVPQEELIEWYDRSDIMLVPSLWKEPFGLVIAEAMARGLPVISSNVGGPAEIITHEVDGILTEPGDEHAIAQTIKELIEDPNKRVRLGKAAQEKVRERFTIEQNAKRVAQHLLRVIQGNEIRTGAASGSV
jgi:glycosyltransferase involved in cell wall biosynthesis